MNEGWVFCLILNFFQKKLESDVTSSCILFINCIKEAWRCSRFKKLSNSQEFPRGPYVIMMKLIYYHLLLKQKGDTDFIIKKIYKNYRKFNFCKGLVLA